MNKIILSDPIQTNQRVNFSDVRLDDWCRLNADEIRRIYLPLSAPGEPLNAPGRRASGTTVGDLFSVWVEQIDADGKPSLLIDGDAGWVDGIGHQHRLGVIHVRGHVGNDCGSCMTGGTIQVDGNAGDNLGGPLGSRGTGMNGGVLNVSGSAGDMAGHRMRRGELTVRGNVGDGLAAWQIAGTIRVFGRVGGNVAYGMRRGTLILDQPIELPDLRFTDPVELRTPLVEVAGWTGEQPWWVRRGDRSIDGIGEVWIVMT